MGLRDEIREVCDPLIREGKTLGEVNEALRRELKVMIGKGGPGGAGSDLDDVCKYCKRTGNGGHGGFCPDGGNW